MNVSTLLTFCIHYKIIVIVSQSEYLRFTSQPTSFNPIFEGNFNDMSSKSDSAGKLHQFYTCKQLEKKSHSAKCNSPLDSKTELDFHLASFNNIEINSLQKIGEQSGDLILSKITGSIIQIEDIGVSSGATSIDNTDDLMITLQNGDKIGHSLKCAKNISQILSKNPGAKSLLSEYFKSPEQQVLFNDEMLKSHLTFLNSILKDKHPNISIAKKLINVHAVENGLDKPRFADPIYEDANEYRNTFLKSLRDSLYNCLSKLDKSQLATATNLILDTGKNHILADYRNNKEKVQFVRIPNKTKDNIHDLELRGNDSVVIITDDYRIGFRYKFESAITSSIKLVGDYTKIK